MNGKRMKEARKKEGLTLKDLAGLTGLTAGFLSQLENGTNTPSIASLRKISKALHCTEMWLLQERASVQPDRKLERELEPSLYAADHPRYLTRREQRVIVHIPQNTTHYEIFTPSKVEADRSANITGMLIRVEVGEWVSEQMLTHDDFDESILILEGRMRAYIDGEEFLLEAGDSLYIPAKHAHNLLNIGQGEVHAVVYFSKLIY